MESEVMIMKKRISWVIGGLLAVGMIFMLFPTGASALTQDMLPEDCGLDETEEESLDTTDPGMDVTPDGTSLPAAYYVTGAAAPVDMNAADGYVPVTGTQNGDRELYSAFYNDMIYERQGGKWYWGHEAVMYGAAGKKVYSDAEKKNETAAPVSFNTDMVFELNYMPVELSDHYRHNLCFSNGSNADWHRLPGVELWAWEYEPYQAADGTTRYRRVKIRQLNASEYEVEYDQDAWFTNYFMQNETEPFNLGSDPNDYYNVEFTAPVFGTKGMLYFDRATLPGSVKLNGSWMKNSSDPVAIVAMIYDATNGTYASVEELARGESSIWENDKYFSMCCLLSDQSSDKYSYSRNFYSDDPYTATALGSFSPKAYDYYKDDASGVITLYSGGNYGGFARGFALGNTDSYRDKTGSDLMIDTWEIPSEWTDDLTGKTYKVRIDNTPIGETDVYRGCLYPCMAETFVIDPGVIMPDDCSYFMLNSVGETRVNFLKNFKINGSPASFGSNIRNLRHFFAKSYSLPDSNYEAIDIRALDTSNVEDMSYMFENVILAGSSTSVNVDVSRFNTSKVKSFEGMFMGYHVTDNGTVRHYYTKVDVSGFDTSNAETMAFMFCDMYMCENTGCGTLDVSNFKFTNKLTDMQGMFAGNPSYETPGLVKIILPADMDTSNVKDMSYLFCADDSLREIVNLSALDTGNVVDISGMFGKYMHDALFGKMSDKKNLPTTYWTSRDTGSWINDRTVASGFENPTIDVRFYGQAGNTDFFGPAIESLDLSNFDTRNVKYAYGAFCWMPNLKEITWGRNTTFEKVTDANYMFILPALKTLDLTGRKLTNIKYAFDMIMIENAQALILGEDSLDLSNIAQDEGFTISAPKVRELDLRKVRFGDNTKALSKYSLYDEYYQIKYVPEGLVAATEFYFPAMPAFDKPADLPTSFTGADGTKYTTVAGGNTEELHLTADDRSSLPPVESVDVKAAIDFGTNGGGWMMNNGEKYKLCATVSPLRADQSVTWVSSDPSIATVDADGIVTAVGGRYGGVNVTITATSVSDKSKSGSTQIKVFLAMLDESDAPKPTPTPGPAPTTAVSMKKVKITGFKGSLPYAQGAAVTQNVKLTYGSGKAAYTLVENTDYTVSYENNHNLGTATVTFEGIKDAGGNYTGSFTDSVAKTFKIAGKYTLTEGYGGNCTVTLDADTWSYANAPIKPSVTVKASIVNNSGVAVEKTLTLGKDYTVSYKNNKAVAAADAKNPKNGKDIAPQVIIKGKGNYVFADTTDMKKGVVKRFAITKCDLSTLVLTVNDVAYNKTAGKYKNTKINFFDHTYKDMKLKADKDYTVAFKTSDGSESPAAGRTVTVTITAVKDSNGNYAGNYEGSVTATYRIVDKKTNTDISKAGALVNPGAGKKSRPCAYTGDEIRPGEDGQPALKLTAGSGKNLRELIKGEDYEILGYYNNINSGNNAVILIRGTGSFYGIRAVKFKIK